MKQKHWHYSINFNKCKHQRNRTHNRTKQLDQQIMLLPTTRQKPWEGAQWLEQQKNPQFRHWVCPDWGKPLPPTISHWRRFCWTQDGPKEPVAQIPGMVPPEIVLLMGPDAPETPLWGLVVATPKALPPRGYASRTPPTNLGPTMFKLRRANQQNMCYPSGNVRI